MEVDHGQFWPKLLPILRSISTAKFVTFDLEMSGISIRQRRDLNDRSRDSGKPTMQQQYEETKGAAEKYQILQVGITCVEEDRELGMYVARPYNFNLSPLFAEDDKLGISRDFTLSSSAIQFLIRNSFDMGAVFTHGVPYLSREEEAAARMVYAEKEARAANNANIDISPSDQEALKFYRKARETIADWFGRKKKELEFINITSPGGLNGFQRRLVHQLVRSEFPTCRTFSRNNGQFMQVEKIDPVREAQIAKARYKGFEMGLAKQTGLRYIIEALAGGDHLEEIDPRYFCVDEAGDPIFINIEAKEKEIKDLQLALKAKDHVIVGHNLFTDLVFVYKTFIAKLPDEVSEFQERIHNLFPRIIDTKYLATHGGGSMQNNRPLRDICSGLESQPWPLIVLDENHSGYLARSKDHEAGYDSWMTAQVLVKLAAKVEATQKNIIGAKSAANVTLYQENAIYKAAYAVEDTGTGSQKIPSNGPDTDLVSEITTSRIADLNGVTRPLKERGTQKTLTPPKSISPKPKRESRFSGGTRFDHLPVEGQSDEDDSSEDSFDMSGQGGVALTVSFNTTKNDNMGMDVRNRFMAISDQGASLQSSHKSNIEIRKERAGPQWHAAQLKPTPAFEFDPRVVSKWIPPFNSSFWNMYTNKLRVFGTESEICYLDG